SFYKLFNSHYGPSSLEIGYVSGTDGYPSIGATTSDTPNRTFTIPMLFHGDDYPDRYWENWHYSNPPGNLYPLGVSKGTIEADFDAALLSIDSNNAYGNDAGFLRSTRIGSEDQPGTTGKILAINNGDANGDGIPDFAEGYGPGRVPQHPGSGTRFVPVVLT